MTNELEVREETGLASDVSPARWTMMLSQSESIVKSGLAPKGDTKETVVIKLLAGREFGLSAMQSLRSLYVVSGKIAMMSDIAAGLVFQRLPGAKIDCVETTDKVATFEASRPGGQVTRLSFTMEDAKRAGLTGGTNWSKYPAQMLRARCQIAIVRLVFPDIAAGLYTPEELGEKNAELGERVPFEDQMAKEKERLAKKELKDAGVIKEAEIVGGEGATLPEPESPASVPVEGIETTPETMTKVQKQDNLIFMGQTMYPDGDDCSNYFIKSSEFTLKEEGKPDKFIKGKDNPYNLKAGRLLNTYRRVKKDYDEWKEAQK